MKITQKDSANIFTNENDKVLAVELEGDIIFLEDIEEREEILAWFKDHYNSEGPDTTLTYNSERFYEQIASVVKVNEKGMFKSNS